MLAVECPNCQIPLQIDEKWAGTTGTCNHCGGKITVPTGAKSDERPGVTGWLLFFCIWLTIIKPLGTFPIAVYTHTRLSGALDGWFFLYGVYVGAVTWRRRA